MSKSQRERIQQDPIYQESIARYEEILEAARKRAVKELAKFRIRNREATEWRRAEEEILEVITEITKAQYAAVAFDLITPDEHQAFALITSSILRRFIKRRGAYVYEMPAE